MISDESCWWQTESWWEIVISVLEFYMLNVKLWPEFHDVIFCLFAKDVIDLCDLDLWKSMLVIYVWTYMYSV